ncbi:MAG: serine hydrolase [Pseudomonadota bacterium]
MRVRGLAGPVLVLLTGTFWSLQASAQPPAEQLEQAVSDAATASRAGAILDVQGCGISFLEARGVADRKTDAPMPTDEQLRVASISKLYTAAVIHELISEERLDLDTPATEYIADSTLDGIPNAEATVRQLLNHTSGIPDYYDARSYIFKNWKKPITPDFSLSVARRRRATNDIGETYAYSNTNYQILALIAEAVTNETFSRLTEQYVLEPLSLRDTRYNTEHPGGTIHGYGTELRRNADTWIYAENTGADSGITATTTDLRMFLEALFLEGGEKFEIGNALLSSQVEAGSERRRDGAGAEIYIGRDGLELIGHTGDTFGYLSFAFAVPQFQATIIGQINADRERIFLELLQDTVAALREACEEG